MPYCFICKIETKSQFEAFHVPPAGSVSPAPMHVACVECVKDVVSSQENPKCPICREPVAEHRFSVTENNHAKCGHVSAILDDTFGFVRWLQFCRRPKADEEDEYCILHGGND